MSSHTPIRPRPRPRPPSTPPSSRRPLVVVAGLVAVVLLAFGVALVAGSGDDGGTTDSAGSTASAEVPSDTPATVEGNPLTPLPDSGDDPAVGTAMPTLSGTGLDGSPVTIPATGRPTMIMFVAHWCPHCQAEVPVVQDWVDGGGLPDGVDLVTVSTAADPRRPNYPPGEWLAGEGWTAPVLVDGENTAAAAAGLTAFPFFVAVDADGNVVTRASGELTPDQLTAIATDLSGGSVVTDDHDPADQTTSAADDPPAGQPAPAGPRIGRVAALIAATTLVLGAGAVVASQRDSGGGGATVTPAIDEGWHGAYLPQPLQRPDFTLTDTAGRPYDFQAETEGRLTLLFFGYTSCPDVCPIHMATLSAALEQPGMPEPVVVFVTTDPVRDTPQQLRSWLDNFGTDFVGLTGTPEQIAAAEDAAGIARSIVAASGATATPDGDYEVGHAAQIIAYTPDDQSHLQYPFGVRRQDWEADLPRLLDVWDRGAEDPAPVTVDGGWAAADDRISAVYLSIDNAGRDDRLVAAESDVAGRVSLMGPGVAMPRDGETEAGTAIDLEIPLGTTELAPGGTHVMLEQLARPLAPGEQITLRLTFAEAGTIEVPVDILDWDQVAERAGER